MSTMEPELVNSVLIWTALWLPHELFMSRFLCYWPVYSFVIKLWERGAIDFKNHILVSFSFLLPLIVALPPFFCLLFLSDAAEQVFVYAEQAVDILSTGSICEHQGLIAVCIDPSVISWCSLPCRPANNQHPLCLLSLPFFFVSLLPFLPPPTPSCLMPVATTTSPTLPLFPRCSARTKKEAISSLREEWWKWRRRESGCIAVKVAMVRWAWEKNSKLVSHETKKWSEWEKCIDSWGKRFRRDNKTNTCVQNWNSYGGKAD